MAVCPNIAAHQHLTLKYRCMRSPSSFCGSHIQCPGCSLSVQEAKLCQPQPSRRPALLPPLLPALRYRAAQLLGEGDAPRRPSRPCPPPSQQRPPSQVEPSSASSISRSRLALCAWCSCTGTTDVKLLLLLQVQVQGSMLSDRDRKPCCWLPGWASGVMLQVLRIWFTCAKARCVQGRGAGVSVEAQQQCSLTSLLHASGRSAQQAWAELISCPQLT